MSKDPTTTMLSFRVDHATAEHLRKYARIRHTTVSKVLRNWSENCDMKIFLPPRAKDKLAIIARGKRTLPPGRLIESAVAKCYRISPWYDEDKFR